jgi:hypothetical protein
MFNYVYGARTMSNPGLEKGFDNKDHLHDSLTKQRLCKDLIT